MKSIKWSGVQRPYRVTGFMGDPTVKPVATVLLIIAGGGAFQHVLTDHMR
jgi:H+/gluconate symporter-like permease